MFTAEIICFGNELLIGKIVNTNATWLGKRLVTIGGLLKKITTVGDNIDEMVSTIREVILRKPDVIITTGGLGSTFDDLALAAVAKATNRKLELNEKAIELIKNRLTEIKKERNIDIPLTEERKRMAMIPTGGIVLRNRAGSAPGVLVNYKNIMIFSVPGVPREMVAIFDYEIINYLPKDPSQQYHEQSLIINHLPESELASAITPIREKYPQAYIKTHPRTTSINGIITVEIHISMFISNDESKIIENIVNELIDVIKEQKGVKGETPKITIGLEHNDKLGDIK